MPGTDWTIYYKGKKSLFSKITQRFTLDIIVECIEKYVTKKAVKILELGGGNSCFAEEICHRQRVAIYDIIDNNTLGVQLFNKKVLNTNKAFGRKMDLLDEEQTIEQKYDFVYSIGLIEHFGERDRNKIIERHFEYCGHEGYVLISFPTPTFKYRFFRKIMEFLGVWQFWDEYPLNYGDVKEKLIKYGTVKEVKLNGKLPLSQMMVVVHKA